MGAAGLFGAGAGLALSGSVLQAQGLKAQGEAAKQRGDYQAGVLRNNKALTDFAAADAINRGKIIVRRQQIATGQFIGRQRAALASAGIVVDQDSAADLVLDTVRAGREAEIDIQKNAQRAALQFQVDSMNFEADAILAQLTGEQQKRAARLAILPTFLSTVGGTAAGGARFATGIG